jgi:predicted nucleic acid-binding protein
LVDTSVWVDHLRSGNQRLRELLLADAVSCHPFVVGELACGNLRNRRQVLYLLENLPQVAVAGDLEVRRLVETRALYGKGLGWVDVHLIASAMISHASLWTLDLPLARAATKLGLGS